MTRMTLSGETSTSRKTRSSVSQTITFNVADVDEEELDEDEPLMGAVPAGKVSGLNKNTAPGLASRSASWMKSNAFNMAGMTQNLSRRLVSLLVSPSGSYSALKPFVTTDFAILTYLCTGNSQCAGVMERGLDMIIEDEAKKFSEDCRKVKQETVELFVKLRDDPKLAANILPMLTFEWTGQRLKTFAEHWLIANSAIVFGTDAPVFLAGNLRSYRYLSHGLHLVRQAANGNRLDALLPLIGNVISDQLIQRFTFQRSDDPEPDILQFTTFMLGWSLAYRYLAKHSSLENVKWRSGFRALQARIHALHNLYSRSMMQLLIAPFTVPVAQPKSFGLTEKQYFVSLGFKKLLKSGASRPESLTSAVIARFPEDVLDDMCGALHEAGLWDSELLEFVDVCQESIEPHSRRIDPLAFAEAERDAAASDPFDKPVGSPAPSNLASSAAVMAAAAVPLLAGREQLQIDLPLDGLPVRRNLGRYSFIVGGLIAAGVAIGYLGLAINYFVDTARRNRRVSAVNEAREHESAEELASMLEDDAVFDRFANETGEIIHSELLAMGLIEAGVLVESEGIEDAPTNRTKRDLTDALVPPLPPSLYSPSPLQSEDAIIPQARILNVSAILPNFSRAPEKQEFVQRVLLDLDPEEFWQALETPADLRIDQDLELSYAGIREAEQLHLDDPACSGDPVRIARETFGKPIESMLSPARLVNRDESEVRGEIAKLLVAGRAYLTLCESASLSKQYYSIRLPEPTIPAELFVPDPDAALAHWSGVLKPGHPISAAIFLLTSRFKKDAQHIYSNLTARRIDIAEIERIFNSLRSELTTESGHRETDARQIAQIALYILPSFERRTLEYFRVMNQVLEDAPGIRPVNPEYDLYEAQVYGVRYAIARTMPQLLPVFQRAPKEMVLLQADFLGDKIYKQVQDFAQAMFYAQLNGGGWSQALDMSIQPERLVDEFTKALGKSDYLQRMNHHALEGLKALKQFKKEEDVGKGPVKRKEYYEQFNGWLDRYLVGASRALTVTRFDSINASPFWIHDPSSVTYRVNIVMSQRSTRAFGRGSYDKKTKTLYWSSLSNDSYMIIETDNTIPEARVVSRNGTQCSKALFAQFFERKEKYEFLDWFGVRTPEKKQVADCIEQLFKVSHIEWNKDIADLEISTEKTGTQVIQQLDTLAIEQLHIFVTNLKESMRAKYWYTAINGALPFYDLGVRLSEDRYYRPDAVRITEEVINLVLLVGDPAVEAGKALGVAAKWGYRSILEGYFAKEAIGQIAVRFGEEAVPIVTDGLINAGQQLSNGIVIGLLMPPLGPLAIPLQIYGLVSLGRRIYQAARSFRFFEPVSRSGAPSPFTAQLAKTGYVKFVKEWPMPWDAPELTLHEYEVTPLGASALRLRGGDGPGEVILAGSWTESLNAVSDFSVSLADAGLPEMESQPAWLEQSTERGGKLLQVLDGTDAIGQSDDSNALLTTTVLKFDPAEDGFVHATVDLSRLDVADSIVLDARIGGRQLLLTGISEDGRRLEIFYFSRFDIEPWSLNYAEAILGAWNTQHPSQALNPSMHEPSPHQLIASMRLTESNLIFGNRWNGRQFDWMTATSDAPAWQQVLLRAGSSFDAQSGQYVNTRIDCRMTALRINEVVKVRTSTSQVRERSRERIKALAGVAEQGAVFYADEMAMMVDVMRDVKLANSPKASIDVVTNAMKDKFGANEVVVEPLILSTKVGRATRRMLLFRIRQNGRVFMAGWAGVSIREPFCLAEQSWFEEARRESEGTTSVLAKVDSQDWTKTFSSSIEELLQSADAQVISIDATALEFGESARLKTGIEPIEKSAEINLRVEQSIDEIDAMVEGYLNDRAPSDFIKKLDDLRDQIQPHAVRVTTVVRLAYDAKAMQAPSCSAALHVTLRNGADFVVPGQPAVKPIVFSSVKDWASRGADLVLTYEEDAPVGSFSRVLTEKSAGRKFFEGAFWKRAGESYEVQSFNPKLTRYLTDQLDQSRAEKNFPWRDVLNSGIRPQSWFESRAYRVQQLNDRISSYANASPPEQFGASTSKTGATGSEENRIAASPASSVERYAVKIQLLLELNLQPRVQEIQPDGSLADREDIIVRRLPSFDLFTDLNEASRMLQDFKEVYQDIKRHAESFEGEIGREVFQLADQEIFNLDVLAHSLEAKLPDLEIYAVGTRSPASLDAAKENLFGFAILSQPAGKNVIVNNALVVHPFVAIREHPSFLLHYQTSKGLDFFRKIQPFALRGVASKLVADAIYASSRNSKAKRVVFEVTDGELRSRAKSLRFERISKDEFDNISTSGERFASPAKQDPEFAVHPASRVWTSSSFTKEAEPALVAHVAARQYDNELISRNFIYGVGAFDFVNLSGRSEQTLALLNGMSTENYIKRVLGVLQGSKSIQSPHKNGFKTYTFPAGYEPDIAVGDLLQNHGIMDFANSRASSLPVRGKVEIRYMLNHANFANLRTFPGDGPAFSLPGDLFRVVALERVSRKDGGVTFNITLDPDDSSTKVWAKSVTGEAIQMEDSIEPVATFAAGRFDIETRRKVMKALSLIGEKDPELRDYRDRPDSKCEVAAERFLKLYKDGFSSILEQLKGPDELALRDVILMLASDSSITFRYMQMGSRPVHVEDFKLQANHFVVILEFPNHADPSAPIKVAVDYTAQQFSGRFKLDEPIIEYEDSWARRYRNGAKRKKGDELIVFNDFPNLSRAKSAGQAIRSDRRPTLEHGSRLTAPGWYSNIPFKITVPPASKGPRSEIRESYLTSLEMIEKLSNDPVASQLLYHDAYEARATERKLDDILVSSYREGVALGGSLKPDVSLREINIKRPVCGAFANNFLKWAAESFFPVVPVGRGAIEQFDSSEFLQKVKSLPAGKDHVFVINIGNLGYKFIFVFPPDLLVDEKPAGVILQSDLGDGVLPELRIDDWIGSGSALRKVTIEDIDRLMNIQGPDLSPEDILLISRTLSESNPYRLKKLEIRTGKPASFSVQQFNPGNLVRNLQFLAPKQAETVGNEASNKIDQAWSTGEQLPKGGRLISRKEWLDCYTSENPEAFIKPLGSTPLYIQEGHRFYRVMYSESHALFLVNPSAVSAETAFYKLFSMKKEWQVIKDRSVWIDDDF
ncbi:cycle-inhibiting factor [Caballeronia sp. LZ065]|uniref:cycle-inhibiting factor n=1 Tax=Caballeronia sp. LZ065 TaxID=3038571 RepID=UPI0028650FDB|nr:cycle-inhibiting factor [Caballeronia sp. LZ065]MDR5779035.1 cycle-inhibiting factor [Caballeronia sp. LZ065]